LSQKMMYSIDCQIFFGIKLCIHPDFRSHRYTGGTSEFLATHVWIVTSD
jgi:hypothetical protein